jgi:uracil-DNA glycosylase family 4
MPENPDCTLCKLHSGAVAVCSWGEPHNLMSGREPTIMVVSRAPNSENFQHTLEQFLRKVDINLNDVYFTQALKCLNFEKNASNADVKTCKNYLDEEIRDLKPKFILTFGNEALLATLGKSGISKYRGRIYEREGAKVIPTISPSAVTRNPGQMPGFYADLQLFSNLVHGREQAIKEPEFETIDTAAKLKKLRRILLHTERIDFDYETHREYFEPEGRPVTLAGTCQVKTKQGMTEYIFALPLYHPESVWKKKWRAVLKYIAPAFERIPRAEAWNGKYDEKWSRQHGCPITVTFDPMLAIHLLDENLQKGLKPTAMARLGVPPWGIDTRSLLDKPLKVILKYNVLDTYYMKLCADQIREELKKQPRLARLMAFLMMPANQELVHSEMNAIWIDVERLRKRKPIIQAELDRIHKELKMHLPDPESDDWPKDAKGRPREINFNASIFARWFLFTWLGIPILARGKEKPNGDPGDPSMAEDLLMELRTEHPAVELMLERVKWNKYLTGFIIPYETSYDEDHRIHTNFKLAGTVTGRLSSGKGDADKVSIGKRKGKEKNLQQVVRDPLIRGVFGAMPGWTFVEADYSQIELRIIAFVSRDRTMLHLYSIGADIHLTTAARVTGLPESKVPKEVRKKVGKPVNFGYAYGMGWKKFIHTAFTNYGAVFSEQEAKASRRTYFDLFSMLPAWHERQRRLVRSNGRVQSPLGRIRHLPDIYSPNEGVRAEAERQAINSPIQGFASDLAVLSMIHINQRFREEGIEGHCLGLVHDAINYEIRDDHVARALPIIKDTMEDMSIVRRKFGVHIDVPIIADLKVGQHWGDSAELTPDQVYAYSSEYKGD